VRIERGKRADLERWLDRVLTAATLSDVLDGVPPGPRSRTP
jgi:hypothetical protein